MKVFLAALFCMFVLCDPLFAERQTEITGAMAYTETVRFDYTKDGTRSPVQFWLELKGSPAVGKPGEAGYIPESGAIYYYLVDMENKKKVDNWLMGFSMMEGPPPSGPYPMSNISIKGNTATFTAFKMKWTVNDGGEGFRKDTVTVDDGFITRDVKLYGGDLRVVNAAMEAHADDEVCMKCYQCHQEQTREMMANGGEHAAMGCGECHADHPPEVQKPYTACIQCHKPHADKMTEEDCGQCHRAHTATKVTYSYNVPSGYCVACHRESADVLASSRSKHSDMACALCHQETHKATVNCQHCHGGTHPKHVMKKVGICASCHNTAHDLESARAK